MAESGLSFDNKPAEVRDLLVRSASAVGVETALVYYAKLALEAAGAPTVEQGEAKLLNSLRQRAAFYGW